MAAPARPFLDRPIARGLALLVLLACLAGLAWLERERWLPSATTAAAEDPAARCFAERAAEIDRMLAEGLIDCAAGGAVQVARRGDVPGDRRGRRPCPARPAAMRLCR